MCEYLYYSRDEFMINLGIIVFLYYTAVWAVVSTLMVYVTRRLDFDSIMVGYILTLYGCATMFSESVLVRFIVPYLGEIRSIKLGLLAFAVQCFIIAWATTIEQLYVSIAFSMLSNLVYPSISSLVSKIMEVEGNDISVFHHRMDEEKNSDLFDDHNPIGEALGTLNGIKAITEGFGPLVFGILMSYYEDFVDPMQGAPYIVAGMLVLWAFLHTYELPDHSFGFYDDLKWFNISAISSLLPNSTANNEMPHVSSTGATVKDVELFGVAPSVTQTNAKHKQTVSDILHNRDNSERKSLLHSDDS